MRDSPGYRALWLGQIVSLLGSNMRIVALSLQIYDLTGSTMAVGLLGLVEVVPLVVMSLYGGALADAVERKRIIFWSQSGLIVVGSALAFVTFVVENPSVGLIYLLAGLASGLNAIDRPARSALVPQLLRPEQVPAAMALRQVLFQITQITGPALGGVLIAATGSIGVVYAMDAASYAAAIFVLRWVPSIPPVSTESGSGVRSVLEGLRFTLSSRILVSIFAIDLIAMIFGMPRAAFPELAREDFGMDARGLGLLYAAPSAGALVGALMSGWVRNVRNTGRGVLVAVGAWGTFIMLAGLSVGYLPATLLFLAAAGAADVFSAVFRGTILLRETPDAVLGRVSALNIMVVTGGPRLGDVEAGLAAEALGAPGSIVLGGVACLAGTAVMAGATKSLRSHQVSGDQLLDSEPADS